MTKIKSIYLNIKILDISILSKALYKLDKLENLYLELLVDKSED
jgi:hypothetical protein